LFSVGPHPSRFAVVVRLVDSHHSAENVADRQQKASNRVHRFARLKTQGKHPEIQHKTPHQQGYTRADVPNWHPSAIRQHFSEQSTDLIDCHPFASHHISLVLDMRTRFGSDVHELRISSNARF
jgi:hypothetical protein